MKSYLIPLAALAALVLSACVPPGRGKQLSDFKDASAGDSMLYYYAQLRAHDYWEDAKTDTALRGVDQRREFLEGVRKGLSVVRDGKDDEAYNNGVSQGVRMAIKLLEFERQFNIDINDDVLIEGLTRGLADSTDDIPEMECQSEFYRLLDEIKRQKREANKGKTQLSLIEEARERGMSKIQPNLYYRIDKRGEGPNAKDGDAIFVSVEYALDNGDDLGFPTPERLTVGAPGVPNVMNEAYSRLNKGMTATFATIAEAVFGTRSDIIGLRPDQVLIITITLNDIVPPQEAEEEIL